MATPTTKVKSVRVLCDPAMFMLIDNQSIPVDQLTVEQAELVAAQHPGRYVEIVEKKVVSPAADPDQGEPQPTAV